MKMGGLQLRNNQSDAIHSFSQKTEQNGKNYSFELRFDCGFWICCWFSKTLISRDLPLLLLCFLNMSSDCTFLRPKLFQPRRRPTKDLPSSSLRKSSIPSKGFNNSSKVSFVAKLISAVFTEKPFLTALD